MTGLCYALTVLIWGTTWIAIKTQLGVVPIEASIAYRFAVAGALLFVGLTVAKRLQPIPLRHHPYVFLQSICLFSCNFLCFYIAETLVPSGIVSVIFSAATIFNLANGMVAFGQRPSARILVGAAFGVAGIVCLFWNEAAAAAFDRNVVIGVMLALLVTRSTLNLFLMIGLVMLMGLVTKNAILLVDFANHARKNGLAMADALLQAGLVRMRPIMMTTAAMVFGMLPLALALNEGGEIQAPMGRAIIGGVITSTLLTLVVVPVLYSYLVRDKKVKVEEAESAAGPSVMPGDLIAK
jgi:drug/metabolite transporter (DMT)-like permease